MPTLPLPLTSRGRRRSALALGAVTLLMASACQDTTPPDTPPASQPAPAAEPSASPPPPEAAVSAGLEYDGKPVHPEAFAPFFPSMSDGSFKSEVNLDGLLNPEGQPAASEVPKEEDGWLTADRSAGNGMISYKYLGEASDGLQGYLASDNSGGTLTEVAVFMVQLEGSTLHRKGYLEAQNIGDKKVTLDGDTLMYGTEAIKIATILDKS